MLWLFFFFFLWWYNFSSANRFGLYLSLLCSASQTALKHMKRSLCEIYTFFLHQHCAYPTVTCAIPNQSVSITELMLHYYSRCQMNGHLQQNNDITRFDFMIFLRFNFAYLHHIRITDMTRTNKNQQTIAHKYTYHHLSIRQLASSNNRFVIIEAATMELLFVMQFYFVIWC